MICGHHEYSALIVTTLRQQFGRWLQYYARGAACSIDNAQECERLKQPAVVYGYGGHQCDVITILDDTNYSERQTSKRFPHYNIERGTAVIAVMQSSPAQFELGYWKLSHSCI